MYMNESYRDMRRDLERLCIFSTQRQAAGVELRRAVWLIEALLAVNDDRNGGGKLIGVIRSALTIRRMPPRHVQHV